MILAHPLRTETVKRQNLRTKRTGVLISPWPDQEENKLQQQYILSFMYPIYNHNWSNISAIYIYIYMYIKQD